MRRPTLRTALGSVAASSIAASAIAFSSIALSSASSVALSSAALASLLTVAGCAAPEQRAAPASRPEPTGSSDVSSPDQAAGMAGEDAEALKLKPGERPPSRRPPDAARRRAVDQPRVRP